MRNFFWNCSDSDNMVPKRLTHIRGATWHAQNIRSWERRYYASPCRLPPLSSRLNRLHCKWTVTAFVFRKMISKRTFQHWPQSHWTQTTGSTQMGMVRLINVFNVFFINIYSPHKIHRLSNDTVNIDNEERKGQNKTETYSRRANFLTR